MDDFYVWEFSKRKRWLFLIIFSLCIALFLWFGRHSSLFVFTKDTPTALIKGNESEANISLTFNISWGEEKVEGILKELKQNQVQATFFVSGEWAERHPAIVERIIEDKHELGMLGYRYKSYLDQEIGQGRKDLLYAKEIFGKLGYEDIELLRPPSGHFNEDVIELAEELGYKVIHWNVNPTDLKKPGAQSIIDHVMEQTSIGDIVLLHASDSAKQTAKAFKTILPGLENKGYRFVPISELMNQAHAESKLVE